MAKDLKVGDRVKVRAYPFQYKGQIMLVYKNQEGVVKIRLDRKSPEQIEKEYLDVFVGQCRRLKKKEKPKTEDDLDVYWGDALRYQCRPLSKKEKEKRKSVVVTKEKLAEAWDKAWNERNEYPYGGNAVLTAICKELGLE